MNVFLLFYFISNIIYHPKNKPKIIQANKLILKIFMFTPITK